ncbi:MAG: GNAT family N-acetyltransferase [Candidatus Doudnabacteria bacterium]|nr:GNAT family N-acetyltransferase [Candidatus Doudnabacteria bacterium]
MDIRILGPENWEKYKQLRLQGLRQDPRAFGKAYEEEVDFTEEEWKGRLSGHKTIYGAEADGKLVGMAGVLFTDKKYFQHMATIVGVYVDPAHRGQGIGKSLVQRLLDDLRRNPKITKVRLSVNTTQDAAIKMYEQIGFVQAGLAKHEMKIGEEYTDQLQMELIF